MIRVRCEHLSVAELSPGARRSEYASRVNPIDYDFGLERGVEYVVMGVQLRGAGAWLYIQKPEAHALLSVAPASLFSCDWTSVPRGWSVRVLEGSAGGTELLPTRLARLEGWFERYLEGDAEVAAILADEFREERDKK